MEGDVKLMAHKLKNIIKSEVFTGVLLILATIVSLLIANSRFGEAYNNFFTFPIIGEFNIHLIINDFLMAIFFLFVGLEIKSEILHGRLSSFKKASFPIIGKLKKLLYASPNLLFAIIKDTIVAIISNTPVNTSDLTICFSLLAIDLMTPSILIIFSNF